MPARINKRQQRELEELEAFAKSAGLESTDDESSIVKNKGVFSVASNLASYPDQDVDGNDEDEDEDDDGSGPSKKPKKSKKKKKKPASKPHVNAPTSLSPPLASQIAQQVDVSRDTLTPSERKALKKAKQKEKKTKVDDEDDLDKALSELAIQLPPRQELSGIQDKGQSFSYLVGVSLHHLNAEAELRKFFGSRVVQATKTKISSLSSSSSSSRRNGGAVKSNLTRPQPHWWTASQREGLSIRPLTAEECQDKFRRRSWDEEINEKWWTVEYSKKYKSMTKAFIKTVLSGDPQGFYELLQKLPWQADTLLQLSEVYRHREEYAQAVDLVERALFTYERSFIGAFNFTSGLNRLDFDRVENRPFFLALHRQVFDLQRRGCIRTAFEFARLLYSLEPWTDPHGSLLHLDQLAIKANMAQWLVDVHDAFNKNRQGTETDGRLDPSLLPGWRYSHALALYVLERNESDHVRSTMALTEAIKDFPTIVPLLADKLEISLTSAVRSHPECKIEVDARSLSKVDGVLHLLSHLYAQRSSGIWKDHAKWFSETVISTFDPSVSSHTHTHTPTPPPPPVIFSTPLRRRRKAFFDLVVDSSEDMTWSFYRHVLVLEAQCRQLLGFVPQDVLKEKGLSCDPLPPRRAVTRYDEVFFEGIEDRGGGARRLKTRRERELDRRRLVQMIPDAGFRQQLEGFFEAQGLEQRFPGGIVQFAQAMAQLAPQELEDLMLNGMLAMGDQDAPGGQEFLVGAVGRAMPGQMPGEEEEEEGLERFENGVDAVQIEAGRDEDEDEDESEDEDGDGDGDGEELAPMPRMIRNILGRLWGRSTPAVEESSSEGEEEEEEEEEDLADLNAVD